MISEDNMAISSFTKARALVLAATVYALTFVAPRSTFAQTTSPVTGNYWNTVHYANWEHGDLPPSKIPWGYITNLIHFAGNTLGAQTNGTYPYWQAPSNWEIDNSYPAYAHIGDTLRAYGAKYGVVIEIDAGFNSSNQYYNLCVKGDTAIATWASQVGHYMAKWNYGGVDFDLEGGGYPVNYGFQKMVKFLHDTLAALNPGKKYCFTASVMPNSGDQSGWGIVGGPNPAINLMDQINPMFYDVSGTFGSPLFKNPNCSTWGSDSGVAMSLLGAGIPANKLGLGYNIQVYHTGSTTACPPGGFGYISKLMNEIQYFPPAAGATIYWDDVAKESYLINTTAGVKVAFEDTNSAFHKADFVRRHGLGGTMGFCLGRGYLANPPAGMRHNMAVEGMGIGLGVAVLGVAPEALPSGYTLSQNYPNPFNPSTVIQYTLGSRSNVTLTIYNVLGQKVATLVNAVQNMGVQSVPWNATSGDGYALPSGVYFYQLRAVPVGNASAAFTQLKKMMLVR